MLQKICMLYSESSDLQTQLFSRSAGFDSDTIVSNVLALKTKRSVAQVYRVSVIITCSAQMGQRSIPYNAHCLDSDLYLCLLAMWIRIGSRMMIMSLIPGLSYIHMTAYKSGNNPAYIKQVTRVRTCIRHTVRYDASYYIVRDTNLSSFTDWWTWSASPSLTYQSDDSLIASRIARSLFGSAYLWTNNSLISIAQNPPSSH
jgi:hypothetical protein